MAMDDMHHNQVRSSLCIIRSTFSVYLFTLHLLELFELIKGATNLLHRIAAKISFLDTNNINSKYILKKFTLRICQK